MIQTTADQLQEIKDLLKTQNSIVRKRLKEKEYFESINKNRVNAIIEQYQMIRRYVENNLLKKMDSIHENKRYTFHFIDNFSEQNPKNISSYFKIIIKNNISNKSNFILVNFNLKDFFVREKKINTNDDIDLTEIQVSAERFTKSKMRKILFDYFEEIIHKDTLSRYASYFIDN